MSRPRLVRPWSIALAAVLWAAAGALADPAPPEGSPVAHGAPASMAGLSDLETGRLLLRAGRLEHARAFLEQARPADEEARIERLFLLGRIEMRLGRPAEAAERFEAILALRPDLTRVRLELARAWYLAGRPDRARHHFRRSLGDELPSSVEAAVEGFLRRIDARRRWSASFAASLLPETRRPDHETVLIGGVPFRLSEEARASSGRGALVSGGLSAHPRLRDDLRAILGASGAAKLYRNSAWNDLFVSGEAGLAKLSERGSLAGGVRLGRRWLDGDADRRSIGPWARLRRRLTGATHLDLALEAEYRSHDTGPQRDGWRVAASPRLAHALSARTTLEGEATFERIGATNKHHASRKLGLELAFSQAFTGGLSLSASAGAEFRRSPTFVARGPRCRAKTVIVGRTDRKTLKA